MISDGNKEKINIKQRDLQFNNSPQYETPSIGENTEYFSSEQYIKKEKIKVFIFCFCKILIIFKEAKVNPVLAKGAISQSLPSVPFLSTPKDL